VSTPEPQRPFEPPASELTRPFWDATREQRLLIQWCTACDAPVWFPREVCVHCLANALEWREAAGTGSVYAFLVEHRPNLPGVFGDEPYVVALVELDEGPRLMTNVIGCPPSSVAVGQRVRVTWEPLSDGRNLPQFEPMSHSGT
jgi:uncharacterized OB-fold protein